MSVAKKTPKFAEGQDMQSWNRITKSDREIRSNKENYHEPRKSSKDHAESSQKKKKKNLIDSGENWHVSNDQPNSKQMNKKRKPLNPVAENNRVPPESESRSHKASELSFDKISITRSKTSEHSTQRTAEDSRLSHKEPKSNKNSHRDKYAKEPVQNPKPHVKVERSLTFEDEDDNKNVKQKNETRNKITKHKKQSSSRGSLQLQPRIIDTEEQEEEEFTNSSVFSTKANSAIQNICVEKSKRNVLSGKDKNSEQRLQQQYSPDSESQNYTRSIKQELKNNVEKARRSKHQNSQHSLEDEFNQINSTLKTSENTSPTCSGLRQNRKKQTRQASGEFKVAPTASELGSKYEIQNKMDLINSLFNQLNFQGAGGEISPFLTTDGSLTNNSKTRALPINGTKKFPTRPEIYEESLATVESTKNKQAFSCMQNDSSSVSINLDRRSSKVSKLNGARIQEAKELGLRKGSGSKHINRDISNEVDCCNYSEVQPKQQTKPSKKHHVESTPTEYLDSESSYAQKKRCSKRQVPVAYSNSVTWDVDENSLEGSGRICQKNNGSFNQNRRIKPLANYEETEELHAEPPRNQVGKILKNRHKPPLPQRVKPVKKIISNEHQELEEPLEEEISSHPTLSEQKETPRDLSHQGSVLNSRRSLSGKDYVSINKVEVKRNGKRLSKDYDRLLKSIDQSIKPLAKSLNLQSIGTAKSLRRSRGSTPSTARKSINGDAVQSFNPSPTSKAAQNKTRGNGGSDGNSKENCAKDKSMETLCDTFVKTTSDFKQFQSEISNLTKQLTQAALLMQGTLQKLEHYQSTEKAQKSTNIHQKSLEKSFDSQEEDDSQDDSDEYE